MRIVKRYSNRKLYDTEARSYITLEEVGVLVRKGVDVKVLDNVSGEDLTTVILSQVLLEKEKKHQNRLPKSFFTSVIQSGTRIKDAIVERGGKIFGEGLESALQRLRIPTRTEFNKLSRTVSDMEKAMRRLEKKIEGGGRKKKK